MAFLAAAMLLGLIPATIARSKGHKFFAWWVYGAVLFIVALPHALLIGHGAGIRTCPFCAEKVRPEAIVCPHCQRELPARAKLPLAAKAAGGDTEAGSEASPGPLSDRDKAILSALSVGCLVWLVVLLDYIHR